MKWCWVGGFGALKSELWSERASRLLASQPTRASSQNVALVVGANGIVGSALVDMLQLDDAPGGPWKVYALCRGPLPPWDASSAATSPTVTRFHMELNDPIAVAVALRPITDITHVFYVAWDPRYTGTEATRANHSMARNILSVVVQTCRDSLVHISLLSDRKGFIDPFESPTTTSYSLELLPPYSEELPCLGYHFDLENALFDAVRARVGVVSFSFHRPTTIFGFSPRSVRNVLTSLCVYAAICRKEGVELRWPGSRAAWEEFSAASDAELVAEHMFWAALEPMVKAEAFNCTNGDVFKWKLLWPILASQFGLKWTGYEGEEHRFKLEEAMAGKEAVWAEIVSENGLVETELDEVTSWHFVDEVLNAEKVDLDLCATNMSKSKEFGFFGFRNTMRSFFLWIHKLKDTKIVPR